MQVDFSRAVLAVQPCSFGDSVDDLSLRLSPAQAAPRPGDERPPVGIEASPSAAPARCMRLPLSRVFELQAWNVLKGVGSEGSIV